MLKKHLSLVFAILTLAAVLLSACAPTAAPTSAPAATEAPAAPAATEAPAAPAAAEPIKFGVIEPLTGPVADSGNYVTDGMKLGVARINNEGGVCGGRMLEPIVMDGKNDPQESANAAELLITRDNVPIIMGAWGSSSTLAVMPVMEKHGVPLLVETSSSVKITSPETPGYKWTYRISATSAMEGLAYKNWIVKEMGMKKAAILNVNNDWGRGAAEVFQKTLEAEGGSIVSVDFIEQSATDVLPQLTNIKNSEADAIFINTSAGQVATILKQYRELGMTQKVFTAGGSNYPITVMNLSSAEVVEGIFFEIMYVPDHFDLAGDPAVAEWYFTEYEKQGYPADGLGESFHGFDGAMAIAKIFEAAKCSTDPEALRAVISTIEFSGLGGVYKFTEAGGHQAFPNVWLTQMVGGKMVVPEFQFNYKYK